MNADVILHSPCTLALDQLKVDRLCANAGGGDKGICVVNAYNVIDSKLLPSSVKNCAQALIS